MTRARISRSPSSGSMRKPHIQANTAGATPKAITSARESSSRPNALAVFVRRAIPPSKKSKHNGNANRLGRQIEVPRVADRSLNRLRDGIVTRRHVAGGEHRGQQIQSLAHPPWRRDLTCCASGRSSHLRNLAQPRRHGQRVGQRPAQWNRPSRDRLRAPSSRQRPGRLRRYASRT